MGNVLSLLKQSTWDSLKQLWTHSKYFRVALCTLLFFIVRSLYNKCYRMHYNLPLNGPIGYPLIGNLGQLLFNLYDFLVRLHSEGDIACYNIGLQSIFVVNHAHIASKLQQSTRRNPLRKSCELMINHQLGTPYMVNCVRQAVDQQPLDGHSAYSLKPQFQRLVFDALMMTCFGVLSDDSFYAQWSQFHVAQRQNEQRNTSMLLFGSQLHTLMDALLGTSTKRDAAIQQMIASFDAHIKPSLSPPRHSSVPLTVYHKMQILHQQLQSQKTTATAAATGADAPEQADEKQQPQVSPENTHQEPDEAATTEWLTDLLSIISDGMDVASDLVPFCIARLCEDQALQNQIYDELFGATFGQYSNINIQNVNEMANFKAFVYDSFRVYGMEKKSTLFEQNMTSRPIPVRVNGQSYSVPPGGVYHINNYAILKSACGADKVEEVEQAKENSRKIQLDLWLTPQQKFRINRSFATCIKPVYIMSMTSLIMALLLFKNKFECDPNDLESSQKQMLRIRTVKRDHSQRNQFMESNFSGEPDFDDFEHIFKKGQTIGSIVQSSSIFDGDGKDAEHVLSATSGTRIRSQLATLQRFPNLQNLTDTSQDNLVNDENDNHGFQVETEFERHSSMMATANVAISNP